MYTHKAGIRQDQAEGNQHEGKPKYFMYDMHDGKMLYLLTQHSLFNRKHHPFLLCNCKRGAGVQDGNHQCKIINDEEQLRLYNRSKRRWDNMEHIESYNEKKKHMDWVDYYNQGISHLGINPTILPRSSIRFDVFHLRGGVTQRLMSNLRKFLMGSTMEIELAEKFSDVLCGFWSEYNVLLWNLNMNFQRLVGSELLLFIKNTDKITSFLKNEYQALPVLDDLCKGLLLWEQISPFLVITEIKNVEEYKKKLEEFENNLRMFYEVGSRSFLTKNPAVVGDDETFYYHVLRFYLPVIAKQTLKDHCLGLGIFTMQGFECRNKESKNTLRRFSNGIGNIAIPNLKRLWDVFSTGFNSY